MTIDLIASKSPIFILEQLYVRLEDKKEIARGRLVSKAWKTAIDQSECLSLLLKREKILTELRTRVMMSQEPEFIIKNKVEFIAHIQLRHSPGGAKKTLAMIPDPKKRAFTFVSFVKDKISEAIDSRKQLPLEIINGSWKTTALGLAQSQNGKQAEFAESESSFDSGESDHQFSDSYSDLVSSSAYYASFHSASQASEEDELLEFVATTEAIYDLASALETARNIMSRRSKRKIGIDILKHLFAKADPEKAAEANCLKTEFTNHLLLHPTIVNDYLAGVEAKINAGCDIQLSLEIIHSMGDERLKKESLEACMKTYAKKAPKEALEIARRMQNPDEKITSLLAVAQGETEEATNKEQALPERITSGEWKRELFKNYPHPLNFDGMNNESWSAHAFTKSIAKIELHYDLETARATALENRFRDEILFDIFMKESATNLTVARTTAESINDAIFKRRAFVNLARKHARTSVEDALIGTETFPESIGFTPIRFFTILGIVNIIDEQAQKRFQVYLKL